MTPERFRHLTEAYGAVPEHWPEAERAEAQALVAQRDPATLAALADASSLDLLLSAHTVAAPGNDLIRRIAEAAPGSSMKKPNWWLSGAGFVGAGVAGIAAGVLAVSLTTSFSGAANGPPSLFDQPGESTVFSGSTSDWSDQ